MLFYLIKWSMYKALFFDLDGTLVDSSLDITNALNYSIRDLGFGPLTIHETINLIGEGISKLIEKATPGLFPEERNDVLEKFLSHYSRHLVDNTTPYQHVEDTLRMLPEYRKAVISNKREMFSRLILEKLKLIRYFDDVVGSDTFNDKKPSPVPVIKLLNKYKIHLTNALFIGDSSIDIATGRNAGIKTVAVTYGYRPMELLKNADFIINNIEELIHILK